MKKKIIKMMKRTKKKIQKKQMSFKNIKVMKKWMIILKKMKKKKLVQKKNKMIMKIKMMVNQKK